MKINKKDYDKQRYVKNKEKILKQTKEYYNNNKEQKARASKKWQLSNRDKTREYSKRYEITHKDKMRAKNKEYYKNNRLYELLRHAKRRHEMDKDVTVEFLKQLLDKQNNRCAVSNIEFNDNLIVKNRSIYRCSIDRIDSKGHYSKDNIQFVCYIVNIMKNALDQKELLDICAKITEFNHA